MLPHRQHYNILFLHVMGPFSQFQLRMMGNHGSIPFSTWHQRLRGIHRVGLPESSPIGRARVSIRELTTGIQYGLYMKTRSCQDYGVDKKRFLISAILSPSPKKLCLCKLAGNSSLDQRVTDPLWWWAPTGTAGRLLLFMLLHSCGNGLVLKWGRASV